jgi:hypothetical protein
MRVKFSLLIALSLITGTCIAQEELNTARGQSYIMTGMSVQMISIQKQETPVNQISFPTTVSFPVGKHVYVTVDHTPALSSWADTADIRISGLSDTWIQGMYVFWEEKAMFNIGIGIPTGKSHLDRRELLLTEFLHENLYRFQLPTYSQGLARKAGITVALPIGKSAILGVGGMYINHEAFVPVRYVYEIKGEERISEEEYNPGDEVTAHVGLDLHLRDDMKLMMDGIYTFYQSDWKGDVEIYKSGEKFVVDLGFFYQLSEQYILGNLKYRQKGKNELWQGGVILEEQKSSYGPQVEIDLIAKVVDLQNGGFFLYGDGRFYGSNEYGIGKANVFGGGFGVHYKLSEISDMNFRLKFLLGKHQIDVNEERDIVGLEIFAGWRFLL